MTNTSPASGKILLIDDLAIFRRLLPPRLGTLGARVEGVANVEEARAYLAEKLPDLILLDVILPGVDGFTFCRELKADPRLREVPVVMLTDLTNNARDRSLEAGADDYMPKRIDDSVMRIRVNLHLNLAELRRRSPARYKPQAMSVLLATAAPSLRVQLPAQFSQDGHATRTVDSLANVAAKLHPADNLLVIDMDLGLEAIHEALSQVRMDPVTAKLSVLLLGAKEQFHHLQGIEHMVDDVLWKPLNAQVTRQRLSYLQELGHRSMAHL